MRMFVKGQVTIPLPVRKQAGVVPGSEVEFHAKGNRIYLHKKTRQARGTPWLGEWPGRARRK